MQDLQMAVNSLQKEKEELVLALQSAKKDTNHAKYAFRWATGDIYPKALITFSHPESPYLTER